MADEREFTNQPANENDENEDLQDLDIDQDETSSVTGGRARLGDPCDGGE